MIVLQILLGVIAITGLVGLAITFTIDCPDQDTVDSAGVVNVTVLTFVLACTVVLFVMLIFNASWYGFAVDPDEQLPII